MQVVELLGEPHNKGGSNVPVWIEVFSTARLAGPSRRDARLVASSMNRSWRRLCVLTKALPQYQDKGVQINFKGLSFEDRTNPIASITLFPPDATAAASGPDAEAKGIH